VRFDSIQKIGDATKYNYWKFERDGSFVLAFFFFGYVIIELSLKLKSGTIRVVATSEMEVLLYCRMVP